MSNSATLNGLQFLRPYLHNAASISTSIKHRSLYLRLFSITCRRHSSRRANLFYDQTKVKRAANVDYKTDVLWGYDDRVATLKAAQALEWPRIQNVPEEITIAEFIQKYKHLKRGAAPHATVVIRGRCACSPRQTPLLIW